jgi:N-acylneuraminate cytidylyltransferase/CMP-N,N'-diacetyllegionaminic acid synthase
LYKNKRILALIPARGGSKGLPGKNIRMLNGKPLIEWTIELAKACDYIDEIFVSTDSKEIADLAEKCGVPVPSLRPVELAEDTSSSIDVILYTINFLKNIYGKSFDILILLQVTSPIRDVEDLKLALKLLIETTAAKSIVGICKTEHAHPDFLACLKGNKFIRPYGKEKFFCKRRQEIQDLYFFNGSLYLSYINTLIEKKSFYHEQTLGYEMPKYKSFDIDDIIDFKINEALMTARENKEL